jgi:hypothetical protein
MLSITLIGGPAQAADAGAVILLDHPPTNIELFQRNTDGTSVAWAATTLRNEIMLSATANLDASPNDCPARARLEVEFRRGHDSFLYQPTQPVFLEQQCPPRTACGELHGTAR